MDDSLKSKLTNYKPSQKTSDLIQSTPILFLVGPTGAGKDSLKDRLLATGEYHHIVSHTTRQPRINHGILEQNGREYFFIDMNKAEQMLDAQEFVEAKVYSSNLYGTSAAEIQAAKNEHKIALTDVEVQGIAEYKTLAPSVMAAFLLPPDFKTWQQRLQRRYGDVVDAVDYNLRLETALDEINQLLNTDYYAAFVNNDIDKTFSALQAYAHSGVSSQKHNKAARDVAQKLANDIQAYLTANSVAL
jgi:guanylate kinase